MTKKLLLCLFLCSAFDLIAPASSHDNASAPVTHGTYKKLGVMGKKFKRDMCQREMLYPFQNICCDACEPGYFAEVIGCTVEDRTTRCKQCTEGKEYMDKYNYKEKCLRCGHCDTAHGFEIEKNCTISQNIICRCGAGFFCNTSEPCRHCAPCDKCEDGIIVEDCTHTKNTKCKKKEKWVIIAVPIVVIGIVVVAGIWLIRKYVIKKQKNRSTITDDSRPEIEPLSYPDIDVSSYIPDIADQMNLKQVKLFVRRLNIPHACIEAIIHDNHNDCTEKKISLLQEWYQRTGRRDAYRTLMNTLRSLRYHGIADDIENKIKSTSV